MENISTNVTYVEATRSQTAIRKGIANIPNFQQLANMKYLANTVFQPLRKHFDKPVAVTSFFRSDALNTALGGAKGSKHTTGQAMDIDADVLGGMSNADIFHYIRKNLPFHKLIWEFGNCTSPDWVHVSCMSTGNARQILVSEKVKDTKTGKQKTIYKTWIG